MPDVDYGKVEYKETYIGSVAIYSCDYGYKLEGNSRRECEHSGYWSGKQPECIKSKLDELYSVHASGLNNVIISIYFREVLCKDVQSPDYGRVEHEGTHVGAKATYTCNDGYKLVGSQKRRCLISGYWSGKEPICKKSKLDDLGFM